MVESKVNNIEAFQISIKGLVQGVGFRPFVYRLANGLNISGWVKNTNEGVIIHAEGDKNLLKEFIIQIHIQKPITSVISEINKAPSQIMAYKTFEIIASESVSDQTTYISPDIAVCADCINDMAKQPRRINYPLTNCCNCGPRFSIIQSLPYDRQSTTMASFVMCNHCKEEYNEVLDRRFHAQPIACNNCGPVYILHQNKGAIQNIEKILISLKEGIEAGGIFSFKGTGGFHLVCDALQEQAVHRLRQIKHRDTKPFAVMFRDIMAAKKYTSVSELEEKELLSFRRPVVILKEKEKLAPSVTLNLDTIGAMLPYMPFHYLLFEHLKTDVLVMTSGNISDEPIIIDNEKAIKQFAECTNGVLIYNRDIFNRTDDSVVFVANDKTRIIRRSRGFVPQPAILNFETEGIFAAGAELTGTFCMGKGNDVIASQYFGDLQNYENFNFYTETFERFKKMFRFQPQMAVCDLHPDYVTTQFAKELNVPLEQVQHHHAHIASVIAENNIKTPVIGIAFDGTGYGTDGNIWGSEILLCEGMEFKRLSHFDYIPIPGGDKAVLEPWRSAVSYLYQYLGKDFTKLQIPFIQELDKTKLELIVQSIDKKINAPLSCSAGRLFDAVTAVTQICAHPTFHAEAPMRLEAAIDSRIKEAYTYLINDDVISFEPMWNELIEDIHLKINSGTMAAKFHNAIVNVIISNCLKFRELTGISTIALSGGSFQNKYLLEKIENLLTENLFTVFSNRQFPSNDGGIAFGQLYIAAKKRKLCA